jgi:hypothetical protein
VKQPSKRRRTQDSSIRRTGWRSLQEFKAFLKQNRGDLEQPVREWLHTSEGETEHIVENVDAVSAIVQKHLDHQPGSNGYVVTGSGAGGSLSSVKSENIFNRIGEGISSAFDKVVAAIRDVPKLFAKPPPKYVDTSYELVSWQPGCPGRIKSIPEESRVTFAPLLPPIPPVDQSSPNAIFLTKAAFVAFLPETLYSPSFEKNDYGVGKEVIDGKVWWQTDACFAQQRLTGPNPMAIEQCQGEDGLRERLQKLYLTHDEVETIVKSVNFNAGVFLLDYSYLVEMNLPVNNKGGCAPATFTVFANVRGSLVPKWIVLVRRSKSLIIAQSPQNSIPWQVAKSMVQCSDLNVHELGYHLTNTHLVAETVIVSTYRYLGPGCEGGAHSIFDYLKPHFDKTLTLNDSARGTLVPSLGKIAGSNQKGLLGIVKKFFTDFDFETANPVSDLTRRGMIDAVGRLTLPSYFYATDSVAIWKALLEFFTSVASHLYVDDVAVCTDSRLQDWAKYIQSNMNAPVQFPEITSKEKLGKILANIVFTVSVQHATVNYLQAYYFGFVKNAPAAIYNDFSKLSSFEEVTADWLDTTKITRLNASFTQRALVELLSVPPADSETLFNQVLAYKKDIPGSGPFVDKLAKSLTEISTIIRSRKSVIPYTCLDPCVSQSKLAGGIFI